MNPYTALKIIHVVSACILFGTGLGTAAYMLFANQTHNLNIIVKATRQVVKADWLFTTTSGIVQAVTGFAMAFLKGYSFASLWLAGAIAGYLIAGVCWLPVVYLQIQMHKIARQCLIQKQPLPQQYYRYYRNWFILGWPAFVSLIAVYYFMVAQPTL